VSSKKPIYSVQTYPVHDENRGGTATLMNVTPSGTASQTLNFRKENVLGQGRILTADPVMLDAAQWTMFMERGHGLHATSMVTIAIAHLGKYIVSFLYFNPLFNTMRKAKEPSIQVIPV
jgi:hypothetical protein